MKNNKPDEIASGKKEPTNNEREHIPTNEEYNTRLKAQLEQKYNALLINEEYLIKNNEELYRWLKGIAKYGNIDRTMLMFKNIQRKTKDETIRIRFFTENNVYCIVAIKREGKRDYLGCTMSCRKALPGENWTRGSDLPDGSYSKETFDKIIRAIIRWEMKNLHLWK